MERERDEEADERREAAIASSASLRPNLKLKNGITEAHLNKLKELHRRRLQIKAKSKAYDRSKGLVDGKGKSHRKGHEASMHADEKPCQTVGNSNSAPISSNQVSDMKSPEEQNVPKDVVPKKRRKLHWGLDTKERWERKSNM